MFCFLVCIFLNFIYVYTKRNVYLLNLRLKISFNNHTEYIKVCILVYSCGV